MALFRNIISIFLAIEISRELIWNQESEDVGKFE